MPPGYTLMPWGHSQRFLGVGMLAKHLARFVRGGLLRFLCLILCLIFCFLNGSLPLLHPPIRDTSLFQLRFKLHQVCLAERCCLVYAVEQVLLNRAFVKIK
jgi:hypothetical protein